MEERGEEEGEGDMRTAGRERADRAHAGGGDTGRGRGAVARGREGLRREDKNEGLYGQQWRTGSLEKTTTPESRGKTSIRDEPSVRLTNRKHRDKALNEKNAAVPSDSTDDA
jgi:hypothetical protein